MAEFVEFGVQYEGLRELLQALRIVQHGLYLAVIDGLDKAGRVIQSDAETRFIQWGGGGVFSSASRQGSITQAAEGFRVLVRPNTSTMPILSVGQSLRRSSDMPRRRANFGGLMMTKALLPARTEKMPDVLTVIDTEVSALLHSHGF